MICALNALSQVRPKGGVKAGKITGDSTPERIRGDRRRFCAVKPE